MSTQASDNVSPYGYGYGEAQAAPPEGTLTDYVEEFNRLLKKLTCDLVIRYPTDAMIARAKKRIMLAMDVDPIFIVKAVGPYLYKYRMGIYAGDADFFIRNAYDDELSQNVDESTELTAYIIPKVKMAWGESDSDQQEDYKDLVILLLDNYLEYRALTMSPGQTQ